MGIGSDNVYPIRTDEIGKIRVDHLGRIPVTSLVLSSIIIFSAIYRVGNSTCQIGGSRAFYGVSHRRNHGDRSI